MKKIFWNLILWVWTFIFFMILMPITFVIQGVITPIEIIANSIQKKKIIKPEEYWLEFYKKMSEKFYDGYVDIYCLYDCEEEDL